MSNGHCRHLAAGFLAALTLGFSAAHATAHHSLASYDDNRVVMITGTLTQAKIANPHSWLWVSVPANQEAGKPDGEEAGDGPTQWAIETAGSAYVLRSIGGTLRDQFAPGQKVSVSFHPARNGGLTGLLVKMTFGNGRVLDGVPLK